MIAGQLLGRDRRLLLFGKPGVGKTTLAAGLAAELSAMGRSVWCLGADPGSPTFGVPGAVCLGLWKGKAWSVQGIEALCSLDAARFRLPLVDSVGILADRVNEGSLILDAPGVVRGVAGAELLTSLIRAAGIDLLLVLQQPDQPLPLQQELRCLEIEVADIKPVAAANRPGKMARARQRTGLWDRYLDEAQECELKLPRLHRIGTPPRNAPAAWLGKQVAFMQQDRTSVMGEVVEVRGEMLKVRVPQLNQPTDVVLVRDACRDSAGLLSTSKPFAEKQVRYIPPADLLPDAVYQQNAGVRPLVQLGTATAVLVNGVFGDPLLHLRLRHQRRSLLFDLGEGARLPARIAHQVSDVFITHAHVDHISGFLWLLRSRIGESSVCRLFGPPGLAGHIMGLINGIHWDRIGRRGPRFEVAELHDACLQRYALQAGQPGCELVKEEVVDAGVVLADRDFQVRAVTLDHRTPVLAFTYEPAQQLNIRKERLREWRLDPGPWLNQLKERCRAGEELSRIQLPGGGEKSVAELADELILVSQGSKLVYATDFADTPENRTGLQALAQGAHTLFCEATFLQQDELQARRTGHLTTLACGEIANQSRVAHLIPFHFSRRYEDDPWRVYQEIAAVCPQLVRPKAYST
ncbi:MAG: Clp1/GlmU family protein [Gammaproteobacteria bacterium]|nr:Clp1/GlmU family protein [Gammaproteobacteria bacterium]